MLVPNNNSVPLSVNFDGPLDYLIFIFHIIFATSTVLVAGSVAITIWANSALLHQNRFIFMLNTSVCDTLIGFSVFYIGLFDVQETYPSRNGTYNMLHCLLGVNILAVLFAQFDRYFAVCHPFVYSRFINRRVVISANVYCWVYSYFNGIISNFMTLSQAIQLYVYGVVTLQLIVFTKVVLTIKLYVVARYQLEREPPSAERETHKESLRIIIFVVISFLVLWYPSFVNVVLRLLLGKGLTFRNDASNAFGSLARLNAVCTPSVYLWGSPALRRAAVRTVWARLCPRRKARYEARRRGSFV